MKTAAAVSPAKMWQDHCGPGSQVCPNCVSQVSTPRCAPTVSQVPAPKGDPTVGQSLLLAPRCAPTISQAPAPRCAPTISQLPTIPFTPRNLTIRGRLLFSPQRDAVSALDLPLLPSWSSSELSKVSVLTGSRATECMHCTKWV